MTDRRKDQNLDRLLDATLAVHLAWNEGIDVSRSLAELVIAVGDVRAAGEATGNTMLMITAEKVLGEVKLATKILVNHGAVSDRFLWAALGAADVLWTVCNWTKEGEAS